MPEKESFEEEYPEFEKEYSGDYYFSFGTEESEEDLKYEEFLKEGPNERVRYQLAARYGIVRALQIDKRPG